MSENGAAEMKILTGIVGAEGFAMGKAHLLERAHFSTPKRSVKQAKIEAEIQRFKSGRKKSLDQLHEALVKVSRRDHRIIIESHMMLTADEMLFEEVQDLIELEHINAEWAVEKAFAEVIKPLNDQDEQYLRERVTDLQHVQRRLQSNMMGLHSERLDSLTEPVIVIGHDLSPADMADINKDYVLAIVIDGGGKTGHTSILARGMNIPTVVGVETATREIQSGEVVIVDAIDGKIIINPHDEVLVDFEARKKLYQEEKVQLLKYKDLPAVTRDNHPLGIAANIELPDEVPHSLQCGVNSIGLFRTEFVYLTSSRIPTEDEQYLLYKDVLERVGPGNWVTIRTLDVGADKVLPGYSQDREANPALGSRAIRFSLMRPDIFREQLRALLRASIHGNLRIMFPMISGLREVQQAKAMLAQAKEELLLEGQEVSESIQIGIMMEVPSAALIADVLAKEVDFFSIGTNDLIQYMLAVDRVNEHVSYLYTPLHPAVLRVIDEVVRKGHEAGIKVSMCGEMAGEIHYLMLLVGLGLDELSMPPNSALKIKWFLRNITYADCKKFTQEVLALESSGDILNYLHQEMSSRFPELFPADFWETHKG